MSHITQITYHKQLASLLFLVCLAACPGNDNDPLLSDQQDAGADSEGLEDRGRDILRTDEGAVPDLLEDHRLSDTPDFGNTDLPHLPDEMSAADFNSDLIFTPDMDSDTFISDVSDEGDAADLLFCNDLDGDGYGLNCELGDDCDDLDPLTYPGATQLCDGNENSCLLSDIPDDELDMDGDFYVTCIGWLDSQGDNPEILGGNDCDDENELVFPGGVDCLDTINYFESFEEGDGGWFTYGISSSWELGTPAAPLINSTAEGDFAWVTNLTGNYNNSELSYLESPSFNFTYLPTDPVFRFSHFRDIETFDAAWFEISLDGGESWDKLGDGDTGINWYNYPWGDWWSDTSAGWIDAEHTLEDTAGEEDVRVRIVMSSDVSNAYEGFAVDNVSIVGGIIDVGVVFIDLTVASCGTYEESPVIVTLENLGTEAVTDFTITLYVDGEEIITETVDATLEMSEDLVWPIEAAVDLSSPEGHEVIVTVTLPLDENPENDTMIREAGIAGITEPLPYFQDFESGDGGWAGYGTNSSWGYGMPSTETIDSAYSGTHAWVTNPDGEHNNSELSYLEMPCIDISDTEIDPFVLFQQNFSTESCCDQGWMEFSTDHGETWRKLSSNTATTINWYSTTGADSSWAGDSLGWRDTRAELRGLAGTDDLRLRFAFSSNLSNAFDGFAVDDFMIMEDAFLDVAVGDVYVDASACTFGATEPVGVSLNNAGTVDISGGTLTLEVDGTIVATEAFDIIIPVGGSAEYIFDATADLSAPGMHDLNVTIEVDGDISSSNNTLTTQAENLSLETALPYFNDFEEDEGGWFTYGTGNSWRWASPAASVISSASSGSFAWVTNPTGEYNNSENSFVESPCFDFSGSTIDPVITFQHQYDTETNYDESWLEISVNGGASWSKILDDGTGVAMNWYNDLVSQWWEGSSEGWRTARASLSGTAGNRDVRIRFAFSTDSSVTYEGVAFDDISIADGEAMIDLSLVEVDVDTSTCVPGAAETVVASIQNRGTVMVSDASLSLYVNGEHIITEPLSSPISTSTTLEHVFSMTIDLSDPGAYDVEVILNTPGDITEEEESLSVLVENLSEETILPYFTDFESSSGGWFSYGEENSWAYGTPSGATISSAASGSFAWATNPSGVYNNNEFSYVESPCFDFSTAETDPALTFQLSLNTETNYDESWVEYSTDGAESWIKLLDDGSAINWYNDLVSLWWEGGDGLWNLTRATLPGTAGLGDVRIRFGFSTDGSVTYEGVAFDDIAISEGSLDDVSVLDVAVDRVACVYGSEETVTASIKNNGTDTLTDVLLTLTVNGVDVVVDPLESPLGVGMNQTHTFSVQADLSEAMTHEILVTAELADDIRPEDNSNSTEVSNFGSAADFPFFSDFEETDGGLFAYGSNSTWEWGAPTGEIISAAASGENAWVTNLDGEYGESERSYLELPCLDFFGLTVDPVISFEHIFETESCCDGGWVEYSINAGESWNKLNGDAEAVNWYNNPLSQRWDGSSEGWRTASSSLRALAGFSDVRIRFSMNSDFAVGGDGFGLDSLSISAGE